MRKITLFNENWYFAKGSDLSFASHENEFEKIDLPHTYNAIDGQDGGDDYYRGQAVYAKRFSYVRDEEYPVTYLEFRGVGQSAEVYLNDVFIGRHDGGYSTFRFNISDALKDENLLLVRCDNSINNTVYPQMADFTFYGGIYRDVCLIQCKKEHFDLDDHGSPGVIITSHLEDSKAVIEAEAWVSAGEEVEFVIEPYKVRVPIENKHSRAVITIEDPHLWNGKKDPYLYEIQAYLIADGEMKDEVRQRFGIREYHIDPNEGFFLNGKSYPLRGVSKHQDRWGVGNAVSKKDLQEDMEIIKELGATTIRLAHYQHDQYFYDLCDENGLIVWAEIPYISRHMPDGKENTLSQMEELIKQNYNHPSIVCWGLSNEITIGGGAESESLINNHLELNDLVHKLDKTRLTTMAHVMSQDPEGTIVSIPDIGSYNHYYGWYVGDTSGYAKFFDKFHAEHPDYCIGLSEYGADANPALHNSDPQRGDYSEEYQAKYHEEVLAFINERPYLWATHVWNMFDFAADARREGGNPGRNQKGLVTMDRKLKKDSFYLYKAFWNSEEEFVHICSRRYVRRNERQTKIKVYSNAEEIEVFLDGKSLGKKRDNRIFEYSAEISGHHVIKAVSENSHDEIEIDYVEKQDESYILKDNGALNWFNENDPAFYCIDDKFGDLLRNKEAAALVQTVMDRAKRSGGELAQEASMNESMMEAMNDMSLSSLLAFGGDSISAKEIRDLNEKLQKIKK